jgi:ribosomal-protein-alanine N-acetyltransferase
MFETYCSRVAQDTIAAERIDLVSFTAEIVAPLLDGRRQEAERLGSFALPSDWPDEHDARFLAVRLDEMRTDPARTPWFVRAVVLRSAERPMIGHVGFHGPPGRNARQEPDAAEVGYTIFPSHRGRGYATEAVQALIGWARAQGIDHFIASISPDNAASLALARRLGFREVGRHWDEEDGEELELELLTGAR